MCTLVLGNDDSYSRRTNASIFPDYGHTVRRVDGMMPCRQPSCSRCAASTEASTIHLDCFQLFKRECRPEKALEHLWIAAAWRTPWRQAPHLLLDDRATLLSSSVCMAYGIPELVSLPSEIVQMVRGYSASSLLWRWSSALDLASRLSVVALEEKLVSIPLCNVLAWERGQPPPPATRPVQPIIRLTIDSYGIKKIERLSENPRYNGQRCDDVAFVLLEEFRLKDVVIHFKVVSM